MSREFFSNDEFKFIDNNTDLRDGYIKSYVGEDNDIILNDMFDELSDIETDKEFRECDEETNKMLKIKSFLLNRSCLSSMYQVVCSTKEKPIIGTTALDTCYGILFYDRRNKEGCCGHAVPGSLFSTMSEMLEWASGRNGEIEYMILPGYRNFEKHDTSKLYELSDYMYDHSPQGVRFIPIKNGVDFRTDRSTLSYEFAFDTEFGKFVSELLFYDPAEHNPRYIKPKYS